MLTNEQRAHDLAMYTLDFRYRHVIQEQANQGKNEIKFDPYSEYLFLYKEYLEIFNRDFPQHDQ
ncbi:hypothetical protein ACH0B5_16835 [Ureibacillus sp. 179-F W5.1 NHS]|uniref:hypothetical protein n=1 Tax=Ureibacillus sp. 179-F W5.1 NHS TaxID=3374297 RepID=UPI003879490B